MIKMINRKRKDMKKMIKKLKDKKAGDALMGLRKLIKGTIKWARRMKSDFNITESELSVSPIRQFRSPSPEATKKSKSKSKKDEENTPPIDVARCLFVKEGAVSSESKASTPVRNNQIKIS